METLTESIALEENRFLGCGVMPPPCNNMLGIHAFRINAGLIPGADPTAVTRALRRAVMARVQRVIGPHKRLPAFFSGHEPDGAPLRRESSSHLAFVFDPDRQRLLVVAPHLLEQRQPTREERQYLLHLDKALVGFNNLRAGRAGRLSLQPAEIVSDRDPLLAPSTAWESVTRYQVTRHAKSTSAAAALTENIVSECLRIGLPRPRVTVLGTQGVRGEGLVGRARLEFQVAVAGPIILGKNRYLGGGVFASADSRLG